MDNMQEVKGFSATAESEDSLAGSSGRALCDLAQIWWL